MTDDGEIEIEVPRDRAGTFEPVIVAKGQTPPASTASTRRSSVSTGGA
ncbi:transposase-like protein [Bradyrhizobium sp. USDA 241]